MLGEQNKDKINEAYNRAQASKRMIGIIDKTTDLIDNVTTENHEASRDTRAALYNILEELEYAASFDLVEYQTLIVEELSKAIEDGDPTEFFDYSVYRNDHALL